MKLMPVAMLLAALVVSPIDADAGRGKVAGVERTAAGHIKRSPRARAEFKRAQPCPSTGRSSGGCPGYVIDHIQPLKRGGADRPSNMQWQTVQAAKEKDRRE